MPSRFGCLCAPFIHHLRKLAKKCRHRLKNDCVCEKKDHCIKVIMFGKSDAGKTTMLRNLVLNYGYLDENWEPREDPFNSSYMENVIRPIIYQKLIFNMNLITLQAKKMGFEMGDPKNEERAKTLLEWQDWYLCDLRVMSPEMTENIRELWKDATVQKMYNDYRTTFNITGNLSYFLDKLDEISDPSYTPSPQDLLHTRRPTVETKCFYFIIDNVKFKIIDVGGNDQQRAHYPEFISEFVKDRSDCSATIHVVIYVTSLSDYNQILVEKHQTETNPRNQQPYTHMDESQKIFRILTSLPELQNATFLLFLNKTDSFRRRMEQFQDFQRYFPQCENPQDPVHCAEHVRDYFEEALQSPKPLHHLVFTQQTCATDTGLMRKIITVAKMQILQQVICRIAQDSAV